MFYNYGIHRKQWAIIKEEVTKHNLTSNEIAKLYELDKRQIWFLFDKLLQSKYDSLYEREQINKEEIKMGDYVHSKDYGRGEVVFISNNKDYIMVSFLDKTNRVMYYADGRPTTETCKITKL